MAVLGVVAAVGTICPGGKPGTDRRRREIMHETPS